jgi:hypothetical protein
MYPTTPVAFGQTSADVTKLQNFLISQGMSIPAGATGYFGAQTQTALSQWQSSHGISSSTPGFGTNWGPQSISAASSTSSSSSSNGNTNTQPTNTNSSGGSSSSSSSSSSSGGLSNSSTSLSPGGPAYTAGDLNTMQNALRWLGVNAKTNGDYNLMASLQSQIGQEQTRESAITTQAQSLISSGAGSVAINNFYASLAPKDQPLVQSTLGSQITSGYVAPTNNNTFSQSTSTGTTGGAQVWDPTTGTWSNFQSISPTSTNTNTTGTGATIPGLPAGVSGALSTLTPDALSGVAPGLTPGTPEYQAAMDKIDTSYYDVMQQQMTATTDQARQVADYNWTQLKSYIQTNLGVTLSNDAVQGWNQIQSLKTQYGALNMEGSGMQNESMDDYLRQVRANDSSQRYQAQTKQDEADQAYYSNYATPDQIQALVASDPTKAQQWGLVPSDGLTMAQRTAAMQAQFPTMSAADIASNLATMYDTNGNYRSALYQKYMTGSNNAIDTGSIDPTQVQYDQYGNITSYGTLKPTDTGILDLQATALQDQTKNVEAGTRAAGLENAAAAKDSTPEAIANGPTDNTTNQFTKSDPTTGGSSAVPTNSATTSTNSTTPSSGNSTSTTTTPVNPYTFTKDSNGNIVTYQNGVRISTGMASSAASQYGYTNNL